MAKIKTFLIKNPKHQVKYAYAKKIYWLVKSIFSPTKYKCEEEILLIVGCGRSGNTMLRKLLMERFLLYIPPETFVLGDAVRTDILCNGFSWSEKVDFLLSKLQFHEQFVTFKLDNLNEFSAIAKDWTLQDQTIGKLFVELYKWIGVKKGIEFEVVGDKTPLNTMSLGLIHRIWPNAKYIYLERDPFDVCSSYANAGLYKKTITDSAERWLNSKIAWRNHKKVISDGNFLEIRYEDLVKAPGNFIDEVHSTFQFKHRDIGINTPSELGDVDMLEHHSNVNKPINSDSIGKGRRTLSEEDKNKITNVIGNQLP